jgi:hypothetical protein
MKVLVFRLFTSARMALAAVGHRQMETPRIKAKLISVGPQE